MDISYNGKWGYTPLIRWSKGVNIRILKPNVNMSLNSNTGLGSAKSLTEWSYFVRPLKCWKCNAGFLMISGIFFIANDDKKSVEQLIQFYRNRADHENDIEQLKNGVSALNNPSDSLISNRAYMTIASLSWDLKAWYGLLLPNRVLGRNIVRMEFKKFIHTFIQIPCLIIKSGKKSRTGWSVIMISSNIF